MIQTIFGVHIPPRKKKQRKTLFTLRFVLTGTIPSQKNRQRSRINRAKAVKQFDQVVRQHGHCSKAEFIKIIKDIKPFIHHGNEFMAWKEAAKKDIAAQALRWKQTYGEQLLYPIGNCSIKIYHYWKDNIVRDNSNKAETLHDLFKDCGIIAGDNWQVLSPNEADADLYDGEILESITVINLTVYK